MKRSVRWLWLVLMYGMLFTACDNNSSAWDEGLPVVMTNPTSPTVIYETEITTVTEPVILPDIESTSRTASTEFMPSLATTTTTLTSQTEETEPTISVLPDIPNVPIRQFTTTQATYPVPTTASTADPGSSQSTASGSTSDSQNGGIWASTTTSAAQTQSTSENAVTSGTGTLSDETPYTKPSLLSSVSRPYGYKNLGEKGLYIYDSIISSVSRKSAYVDLSDRDDITTQDYCDVYELVYNDENSIFYLDTKMQYSIVTTTQRLKSATIFYKYNSSETERMQNEIDAEVNNILSKVSSDMSQYDIVKLFYDYLAENVVYDEDAPHHSDIYGVFVDKRAICGGYSKAFSYLCDQVGIETLTITGDADGTPHMWNMIKLGGEWYHIDITYAVTDSKLGSYVRYDYFCITDEVINRSRNVYAQTYSYPEAKSERFNYFVVNGLVADSYDKAYEMLYDQIIKASANKELIAQIQCSSKAVYDDVVYNLFSPSRKQALDLMEDALTNSANKFKSDNISYGQDDTTYVVKLFLEYTN